MTLIVVIAIPEKDNYYLRQMTESMLTLLCCPVTRSSLRLQIISTQEKKYNDSTTSIIFSGMLFADHEWFYPIIDGIPRLTVESFIDYSSFLSLHLPDYEERKQLLLSKYPGLLNYVIGKNRRTKKSFEQEWSIFNYEEDKTWDADKNQMLQRFLRETDETLLSIKGKLIFDAGCGNGLLNQFIAANNCTVLGMDFSRSVEQAFKKNTNKNALFIQGDVQFPPVIFDHFDIVHCSGVLIHTNNSELSFNCLVPCVRNKGKLSVWLYHPRKDWMHQAILFTRKITSRLPLRFQYYLYQFTLLPISFIIKRLKGNKQSRREMMIDILDQFSPQFRWEHTHDEAITWFTKRSFSQVKITDTTIFGFNIIGTKNQ